MNASTSFMARSWPDVSAPRRRDRAILCVLAGLPGRVDGVGLFSSARWSTDTTPAAEQDVLAGTAAAATDDSAATTEEVESAWEGLGVNVIEGTGPGTTPSPTQSLDNVAEDRVGDGVGQAGLQDEGDNIDMISALQEGGGDHVRALRDEEDLHLSAMQPGAEEDLSALQEDESALQDEDEQEDLSTIDLAELDRRLRADDPPHETILPWGEDDPPHENDSVFSALEVHEEDVLLAGVRGDEDVEDDSARQEDDPPHETTEEVFIIRFLPPHPTMVSHLPHYLSMYVLDRISDASLHL